MAGARAWRDARAHDAELFFWRTRGGAEVDLVIERGEALLAVEIKSSARPRPRDLRGLRTFQEEYGDRVKGAVVLHDGEELSWLADGVLGMPWWRLI